MLVRRDGEQRQHPQRIAEECRAHTREEADGEERDEKPVAAPHDADCCKRQCHASKIRGARRLLRIAAIARHRSWQQRIARGLDTFGRLRIVGEQYLELCEDVFPVLDRMELSHGWTRCEGTRR